mmetsp:Transcript_12951/g.32845  ORF Transcript_12951/g.32845 Transcript_12951/m.32845 type:complete len:83 (-) Transcript_12951:1131-1379(-)
MPYEALCSYELARSLMKSSIFLSEPLFNFELSNCRRADGKIISSIHNDHLAIYNLVSTIRSRWASPDCGEACSIRTSEKPYP